MKFASLAKVCWLMLPKSETESPYVCRSLDRHERFRSTFKKTSERSRLGGLVPTRPVGQGRGYFPNFFRNASVNAGTIWNRSPTTP